MTLFRFNADTRLILLGALLFTFMAASSAPTPLYARYQHAWGFSTFWLT